MPYGIILLLAITLATQRGDKECLVGREEQVFLAPNIGAVLNPMLIHSRQTRFGVWFPWQLHVHIILTLTALA
jgi:hypothetical protein